jgi:hypothetical protein
MFQGRESHVTRLRLVLTWLVVIGFAMGGDFAVNFAGHYFKWNEAVFFGATTGFWWFFAACMATWIIRIYRHTQKDFLATEGAQMPAAPVTALRYGSIVLGTHFMMFWGVIQMAWGAHDQFGTAIIAGMATALALLNFFLYRRRNGAAMGPAYLQQVGSCALLLLVMVNLRFDVWFAHSYGISVAELPGRVPMWIVPMLSLVLVLWSVFMLSVTKPKTTDVVSARRASTSAN